MIERDWLERRFTVPGTTPRIVAGELGCDERTVRRCKDRWGIASRPRGEVAHLRQANALTLTDMQRQVLDGELLGDGSLTARARQGGTPRSAKYAHSTSRRAYLDWLPTQLGVDGSVHGPYDRNGGRYWVFVSRSYATLLPVWKRWYGAGSKGVPGDLVLTPTVVRHWFIGDGYLAPAGPKVGKRPVVRLSTDGFSEADVVRLADQLGMGAVARQYGKGFRIRVPAEPFLAYIGPCPVADYTYKWGAP